MEEIIKYEGEDYMSCIYRNKEGLWHNINDEPAIIYIDGRNDWYKNGLAHRTKGPALIDIHYNEYWYYEGKEITKQVNQLMEEGKINPDWRNWTEEDEFLFVLLVS